MGDRRDGESRRRETEAWDRVAAGWARRWEVFEAGARDLSELMVRLAGIVEGSRVLDVATGVGEPALTAARRVGPGGRVVAVDRSPAMVGMVRRRAQAADMGNVVARCLAVEDLATDGTAHDAVLCRWGLMLFDDPDAALATFRRTLVPGGRLVAAVWAGPERMPMLALLDEATRAAFDAPPPEPGRPGPFALSDEGALARRVARAGFREVDTRRVICPFSFDSPEAFRAFEEEVSMTLVTAAGEHPPEAMAVARRTLESGAARYRDGSGRVVLPCESIVVCGSAPGG